MVLVCVRGVVFVFYVCYGFAICGVVWFGVACLCGFDCLCGRLVMILASDDG